MEHAKYRLRIYSAYASARLKSHVPSTIDELAPRASYLRRLIRNHFPDDRNVTILDLGCGHGAIAYFARELGYRNVRGVDGSPEQVAAAKNLGVNGVELGDLTRVLSETPTGSIDVVITFDVIEHFSRDELVDMVDDIHRVLSDGGCWIIHVPNGESPFGARIRYGDITHEMAFTSTSLGQLLLSSGFRYLQCYEDQPVIHGAKSALRWLLWKVVRGALRAYLMIETGDSGRDAIFSQNLLAVAFK